MFAEERIHQILNILEKEGKVLVKDLSIKFNVTEGMIRKDLQRLEKEGKIKRTYGGAMLTRTIAKNTNISNRMVKNIDLKNIIASKAFENIEDNDTIFLDISSINFLLAEYLAKSAKKVTILTNMMEIAPLFRENTAANIICIGGVYNKKLGGAVGSEAIDSISKYRVNKSFVGSCGVNLLDKSISNFDLEEGNTKKAIISISKLTYVLMENEKFYYDGTYKFAKLSDIDAVITEDKPSSEISKLLLEYNIAIF